MLRERMLPAPMDGGFRMEGYWVWCGSVVKGEDGRYHMFASRWPKKYPMHPGWLLASEVVRAVSDVPEGPYRFEEVVLPARGAQYWDGRMTHNPSVMKVGDYYVLYYIGSTHPFEDVPEGSEVTREDPRVIVLRSNKRIGVAISKSVYGPWSRLNSPVLNVRPDHFDNFLVSNPAPCQRPDGGMLMVYKTRSYIAPPYNRPLQGKMQLGVAMAPGISGPFTAQTEAPLITGDGYELEDPFVWHDGEQYHMMAKDMNGKICGEKFGGTYSHSSDGIHWQVEPGLLYYSRKILWDDGIVREMGNLERPFILFEDGKATHLFFATSDGKNGAGFMACQNTWNMVIPLKSE